jgi:hypothetical protein
MATKSSGERFQSSDNTHEGHLKEDWCNAEECGEYAAD